MASVKKSLSPTQGDTNKGAMAALSWPLEPEALPDDLLCPPKWLPTPEPEDEFVQTSESWQFQLFKIVRFLSK
jgi:hypothetical protein